MSVVPTLVERGRLTAANALTQGVEQTSGILGPVFAGLMLALVGVWINLGANAALFLIAALFFAAAGRAASSPVLDSKCVEAEGHEGGAGNVSGDAVS